ncbi:MAG: FUSC family membrane protein [Telluria sp.]|nr:FUSC family membrane protein [Telluria sp.]
MQYALAPSTFLFSHYFYTGVRIAIGIVGLTFLTLFLADLPSAMAVAFGALCTSLMDMPSPLRHKFNEMMAAVLLCSLVALVVSLCTPVQWLLITVIVLVSFLASMMVVYGRKAMPLQFAALFVMMLSTETPATPLQALRYSGLFFVGGIAYVAYAIAVVWAMQQRLKQQVLAEALYELARYTDIKAGCYDVSKELNGQLEKLVRQQIVLAEKQQAARDLILRGRRTGADAILIQVHYVMFDLYELVLASHTDYALLRQHFAGTDVLTLLGRLVSKGARDIESVAHAMMRNRASRRTVDYTEETDALEHALRIAGSGGGTAGEARAVLHAAVTKANEIIRTIARMHSATQAPAAVLPIVSGSDLTPFLTQQRYGLGILLSNLRWTSPTFRFALRVALAILTGMLASKLLPSSSSYGYWTVLTIAVILKPSFSMTKKRRADRLIGTVIGCILTALILRFVHAPAALIGFLFLATTAAPAFLYINYRYTAIAVSMQILLLINLTVPTASHTVSERLLDTLVGAVIATFFSYVLPNWEYRALPLLLAGVLKASQQYIDAGRDLLQGRVQDDFLYRLSRKRFMDSLASLSAALGRMLDEPAAKQRATAELNRFTVQNYLLVSHFAALRLLLQRHKEGLPREAVNAVLDQVCGQVQGALTQARQALGAVAPGKEPAHGATGVAIPATQAPGWSGWPVLQRRVGLLLQDAADIALASRPIGDALERAAR